MSFIQQEFLEAAGASSLEPERFSLWLVFTLLCIDSPASKQEWQLRLTSPDV